MTLILSLPLMAVKAIANILFAANPIDEQLNAIRSRAEMMRTMGL